MSFRPRHLVIRFVGPLALRLGLRRPEQVFLEFARIELDSAWQSINALPDVADPAIAAMLFEHAFEELYHYDLFTKLALKKARDLPTQLTISREELLELEGGKRRTLVEFLAFLAVGEHEIQQDFRVYAQSLADADAKALFRHVAQDEVAHASVTNAALLRFASEENLSLSWLRIRHLASLGYKRYIRFVSRFGIWPLNGLLGGIYFVLGGTFAGQAREFLNGAQVRQLGIIREQQRSTDRKLREARR